MRVQEIHNWNEIWMLCTTDDDDYDYDDDDNDTDDRNQQEIKWNEMNYISNLNFSNALLSHDWKSHSRLQNSL